MTVNYGSGSEFVAELERRLKDRLPGDAAHARFSPRPPRGGSFARTVPPDARQAAALILLYPTGGSDYSLPLTVRNADLPDHAGQISLPGGRIDVGETAEAAALREAAEEIGVDPSHVRILGALTPLYVFVSRFVVTSFVGVVDARPNFQLAAREVAELLEVPLSDLRDPSRIQWGTKTREGYVVDFPYIQIGDHQLWGATAMMLGELVAILD